MKNCKCKPKYNKAKVRKMLEFKVHILFHILTITVVAAMVYSNALIGLLIGVGGFSILYYQVHQAYIKAGGKENETN